MASQPSLPGWLKPLNRLTIFLQRRGLSLGPVHILSVPGRKSGQMRTTPVSLLTMNGQRYTVGGMIQADWVKNARAALPDAFAALADRCAVFRIEPLSDEKPEN